ncbi:MAG: rhomboid protease GluP [Glaciecola sp.]|jgi:rhomboid protease GluP
MSASPQPPAATAGPTFAQRFASSPAVWTLGLLNVLAFLLVETQGGSTSRQVMLDSGALLVPTPGGEWWRLLTSTFLHFGFFHLASNMAGLAIFGPAFEKMVGTPRFVALWLAAGLAGSAATVLAAGDGFTLAAGASGSVFGLLGGFLFIGLRTRQTPEGADRLRQATVLLVINLGYGLITPSIGLAAHIGGTVAGLLILFAYAVPKLAPGALAPPPQPNRGLWLALAVGAASVAVAVLTGPTL